MTTQTIAARRRDFLVEPGAGVVLSADLDEYLLNYTRFLNETGLSENDVVSSPVVMIPIPQAVKDSNDVPLRWDGVEPGMLWHPFFWLPPSVSLRAQIVNADGESQVETDEQYLIRVIVQCVSSGVLDVESGTWLDVPSYYGVDIEDPEVLDRLVAWHGGSDDELFDALDTELLFANCGIDSSVVHDAILDTPRLIRAQWAYTANEMGRTIRDIQEDVEMQKFPDEVQRQITMELLVTAFVGLPGGELISDTNPREQVEPLVLELETRGDEADWSSIRVRLLEICARIYVTSKPDLDLVNEGADRMDSAYLEQVGALN